MKQSLAVKINNGLILAEVIIRRGVPPRLWGRVKQDLEELHRQAVHKAVWELKVAGKVREDEEGRLWSTQWTGEE